MDTATTEPAAAAPAPLRVPPVLAPILPALLLVGVCVAGLSDPQPAGAGSRLHVPPAAAATTVAR